MKTNVLCLDCWNEGAGSKSFDISKNFIFWNTIAVSRHGGWWQKLYFIVRRNKELYSVLCVMKYWLCCRSLEQSSAHFSFLTNFINLCFISLFSPHVYAIACISLLSFSLFRKLNVYLLPRSLTCSMNRRKERIPLPVFFTSHFFSSIYWSVNAVHGISVAANWHSVWHSFMQMTSFLSIFNVLRVLTMSVCIENRTFFWSSKS